MNKRINKIFLTVAATAALSVGSLSFSMDENTNSFSIRIFSAINNGNLEKVKKVVLEQINGTALTEIDEAKKNNKQPSFLENTDEFTKNIKIGKDIKHKILGETPLGAACRKKKADIVEFLLPYCSEETVNEADNVSRTPLFWACFHGNLKIVELLLANGAKKSVNIADKNGASPLYLACSDVNIGIIELLLRNGANVNVISCNGATPLLLACQSNNTGNLKAVRLLLANGAQKYINLSDKLGMPPLCYACRNGNIEIVKLLLQNGADINKPGFEGVTPLLLAGQNDNPWNLELVKLLIYNGANISREFTDAVQNKPAILRFLRSIEEYSEMRNKVEFILNKQAEEQLTDELLDIVFTRSILGIACGNMDTNGAIIKMVPGDTIFYKIYNESISKKLSNIIKRSKIFRKDLLIAVDEFERRLKDHFFFKFNENMKKITTDLKIILGGSQEEENNSDKEENDSDVEMGEKGENREKEGSNLRKRDWDENEDDDERKNKKRKMEKDGKI